jgi:tRNA threonylcarbamoyladenosine biosynthesis protein TsaB
MSTKAPLHRLVIDTSSEHCLIGIACRGQILASQISPHANQLSQSLMPTLQALLEKADIRLNQLHEIAVGIGPGSYTGTRVGVAVAKSLCFALQTPQLKGFCSLLAFIPPTEGAFACVMPSKTGDVYLLKGIQTTERLTCNRSCLISPSALLDELTGVSIFVGKPLQEIKTLFPDFSIQWVQPEPRLEPILAFLETDQESCLKVDLIYLHKP